MKSKNAVIKDMESIGYENIDGVEYHELKDVGEVEIYHPDGILFFKPKENFPKRIKSPVYEKTYADIKENGEIEITDDDNVVQIDCDELNWLESVIKKAKDVLK